MRNFGLGILCLLLLNVALGQESECYRCEPCVWLDCDDSICFDVCEATFDDNGEAQTLSSFSIRDTQDCLCHIRSKTLCESNSPAPSPALAPSTQ